MKKIFLLIAIFLSLIANAQNSEIENGVYIAKNKGQKIKLILSENKNYDLSFMSGKYDVKNDSIILKNPSERKSNFDLVYTFGQNIKFDKIRIKLNCSYYDFESVYIASFNGSAAPIYKRVSDILKENEIESTSGVAIFDIDRADFLVLAKENYVLITEISKFKIADKVTEIEITDRSNEDQTLNLAGIFDKNAKTLTISENSKNPIVFNLESQFIENQIDIIQPFESKKVNNWNYPGKDNYQIDAAKSAEYAGTVMDSAATATVEPINFQLKVAKSFLDALKETNKTPNKFLVIYYDAKSKVAKSQFDEYIVNQSKDIGYNMYSGYDPQYDLYNYYMASKSDEKWFKNNKIKEFPCLVVVNKEGEILSQSNKSIFDLQNQFHYYDDFNKKLKRTNALLSFKKAMDKKQSDSEAIKAFSEVSALEIPYEYTDDSQKAGYDAPILMEDVKFVPPTIVKEEIEFKEIQKDEIKINPNSEDVPEKIEEAPMATETVYDEKPDYNIFTKVNFDKKQVQMTWNNLIQNHKKDKQPNIDLTLTIIKELGNQGFTKQLFNEEKILDTTNFEALDYLFKHFDAIEKARINSKYNVDAIHNIDFLETEIGKILTGAVRLIKPETPMETQQKIVTYYKKLQTIDKSNNDLIIDYFNLLKDIATKTNSETQYILEYDAFFNETFNGKINVFEKLDDLFTNQNHFGIDYWSEFKNSYSNVSNDAAWYVVENSKKPETIKKAIKWSENSLLITQKNHYYLDTLAQLYYKNGEKEKAIETEQLAIDNNNLDKENIDSYRDTLEKMKNGTY